MKRKISIAACALVLTLGFTGCGSKAAIDYDEAVLTQSCENVFSIVQSGSITGKDISSMSEWNQGYLMAQFETQTGVQMEADDLITALEGWQASVEECGDYVTHGDYEVEAGSSNVVVQTEAQFADRTASLVFTFNKEMELDSFTVDAHYQTSEILQKAGLNTLLGMGTVFAMLILMSLIISCMKFIPALLDRKSKKAEKEEMSQKAEAVSVVEEVIEEPETDDTELIAVIAAAIAASEGTTPDGFVVRSIKRRKSNKWNA